MTCTASLRSRGTKPTRSAGTGRHVPRRDFRVEPYAIAVAEWVATDLSSRLPRTHWPAPLPASLMEGRQRAREPRPEPAGRDNPGLRRRRVRARHLAHPDEARHGTPMSGHSPNAETAGPLRVARQSTRRQTLTRGLTDSPAGLAGWMIEKFRAWSDCGGAAAHRLSKDEQLTPVTLYWVTGTTGLQRSRYFPATCRARFGPEWNAPATSSTRPRCPAVPTSRPLRSQNSSLATSADSPPTADR